MKWKWRQRKNRKASQDSRGPVFVKQEVLHEVEDRLHALYPDEFADPEEILPQREETKGGNSLG